MAQVGVAGEIRDGFKFRGGHVALDLAATLAARRREQPRELLQSPHDLARWLVAAGLTAGVPTATDADLARARTLREVLYRLAVARARHERLSPSDRRLLNRCAAGQAAAPQLGADGRTHVTGSVTSLLVSIARDGVELLGGEQAARIRQCAGETCALLFVDGSRAGARRWCSMAGCGNKAKVADFRRRERRGGQ